MYKIHGGFTMAAVLKPDHLQALKDLLKLLSKEPNPQTNFTHSASVLFVSGVVLPAQDYLPETPKQETLPATLVLATTFCGALDNHLNELVKKSRKGLIGMFNHCTDFNSRHAENDDALIGYLKSHQLHSTFNSRYNCITKEDVQREKELRNEIELYIDRANKLKAFDCLTPGQIKVLIQRHIKTRGDEYYWALRPARKNVIEFFATNPVVVLWSIFIVSWFLLYFSWPGSFFKFVSIFLAFAGLAVLLIIAALWHISKPKNKTACRPPDAHSREIAATQLRPVLNEMTAAGPLKAGTLRKYFYAAALRIVGLLAPSLLKVPTVSSIRWLVTDNKKRLLFLSNYSNSTDFYVRDFLNGLTPRGVNFMFTNGMGFPDAKFLISGGIKNDPEGFMNAVHAGQHVTDLWYAHEKNVTVDIINKNRKIRNGLFQKMNEDETRKWLHLL